MLCYTFIHNINVVLHFYSQHKCCVTLLLNINNILKSHPLPPLLKGEGESLPRAERGSRTLTRFESRWILSPVRLPIPPFRQRTKYHH